MSDPRIPNPVGAPPWMADVIRQVEALFRERLDVPAEAGEDGEFLASDGTWKLVDATTIPVTPAGGIASDTVQEALEELDTEKLAASVATAFGLLVLACSDAAALRSLLSLGSLATASSINNGNWSGTALAIGNGGTGATTAANARTALGVPAAASGAHTGNSTFENIIASGGVTTSGSLRGGGLRIDETPFTIGSVVATHYATINMNGTSYKLLLAS